MVNGAFMVLKGHRSIVNQVRFNPHTYMICSSGVEKVIKVSKWMKWNFYHTLRFYDKALCDFLDNVFMYLNNKSIGFLKYC